MRTMCQNVRLPRLPYQLVLTVVLAALPAAAQAAGDQLKPDELQTTGISANPANDSGMFVGAGVAFGQSRTTEEGASPGLAYFMKFEPGYQRNTGSWNRLEFSADILFGSMSFRLREADGGKINMPVGLGLMPKVGYGYSIGDKMIALFKFGVGPMQAKFKGSVGGTDFESEALSGLATNLAWIMVIPFGSVMDGTAGLSWTHAQFDVDQVKFEGAGKQDLDRTVIANTIAAEAGLRFRF